MVDTKILPNGCSTTVEATNTDMAPHSNGRSPVSNGKSSGDAPREQTKSTRPSRAQLLAKMYSLPAPIRTFPLPTFVPHNPISLLQIAYTWISQVVSPPSSHSLPLHQGWFSPETKSVHITNPVSIRALWEQGFYGKGTLSRSEPSWLDRERKRRGTAAQATSEEYTRKRRAERQQSKWERARKEREAIELKLLEESIEDSASNVVAIPKAVAAPTGPLELLALPNSGAELQVSPAQGNLEPVEQVRANHVNLDDEEEAEEESHQANGDAHLNGANGIAGSGDAHNDGAVSPESLKRQKSVRFSPAVEQTTFLRTDPPSPDLAATVSEPEQPVVIEDQEHFQLTMEEAFFLTYGLGVLEVLDPATKAAIPTKDLFNVFRRSSFFEPSEASTDSPDDQFMISYVVYHHFRSLGWVVRAGTKFAVDYMIYNRGPVFTHAEFAIVILPSYTDGYWSSTANLREYVAKREKRSWSSLHGVNRVNALAKKTVVLVYVDIPPPSPVAKETDQVTGIDVILGRYKVREFVLRRWVYNRSRD